MRINYKGLWIILINREIKKMEFRNGVDISSSTLAKLSKNEYVSMDILVRICNYLECQISDICEVELENKK